MVSDTKISQYVDRRINSTDQSMDEEVKALRLLGTPVTDEQSMSSIGCPAAIASSLKLG